MLQYKHFANVQSCKLVYFKSGLILNLFAVESVHLDSPNMDLWMCIIEFSEAKYYIHSLDDDIIYSTLNYV